MAMRFCANLSFMFQENGSLIERYKAAKAAGFEAVECAFPYDFTIEKLLEEKKKANVHQVLINAYPGIWTKGERGLAALPGRRHDFEKSIYTSVEYATNLGCERIHIMSGLGNAESPENLATYIENLKFASKVLEDNKITGVIEPINCHSMPNYFLNCYKKALLVIQSINSNHLKLQLDIFHLQQICGNLSRNIKDFLPYVGHVQIAQVPNRNEPNIPGEIDYNYILSYLNQLGYKGWIGLEYTPKMGTVEGLRWITEMGYKL